MSHLELRIVQRAGERRFLRKKNDSGTIQMYPKLRHILLRAEHVYLLVIPNFANSSPIDGIHF